MPCVSCVARASRTRSPLFTASPVEPVQGVRLKSSPFAPAPGVLRHGELAALTQPRSLRAPAHPRWLFAVCCLDSWMSATRSPKPTAAAWSIATSNPGTSCLVRTARHWSSTGAWPRSCSGSRSGR
jgi:hypothetical protein